MGTITDRFHEENYTDKISQVKTKAKYLVEIESTGEIVVGVWYYYRIYIQKIVEDTVIWTPVNERCRIISSLAGII